MTIARLRLVFAALAIALAIPGALLVRRALASVALEREARERAVAERVFDEMERTLTEVLREEEARPANDYDFASATSALREKPEGALALGWFQIEADGRVTTPAWAGQTARLGEEIAAEGARFEVTRPGSAVAPAPAAIARAKPARVPAPSASPAPLPDSAKAKPALAAPTAPEPPSSESVRAAVDEVDRELEPYSDAIPSLDSVASASAQPARPPDAYDALSKLNTGAKEREQRKQRVYVEEQALAEHSDARAQAAPQTSSLAPQAARAASAGEASADSRERSAELVSDAMATPVASEWSEPKDDAGAAAAREEAKVESLPDAVILPEQQPALDAEPLAPAERAAGAPPAIAQLAGTTAQAPRSDARDDARPGSELVRVAVDPMRGRIAHSGELLLVRSAWIGARGVRQGAAYDVSALERLLAAKALGDGALPGARVRIAAFAGFAQNAGADQPATLRSFAHRFAEPFDSLGAELSFAPFTDAGARSVYWLAALFALAGAGGLFAVYRMTAVALHFAERRSNFAAAVSHELKTPLTAIRLYAEMLRDGLVSGDEKRREYYGSITAETERLSRLINNVLEFSRIEKGVRSVALQIGDAAPVVREAVELLRAHAAEHGLELALTVDEPLPPVRFERDALLQIVFNLVDNAVKYGRGEPSRVEVACKRAAEGVAIVVRDHGPGVPREELAHILEPFYRRGDELTRSAPGAGIGLALVRSLAQQMGAALGVANAEGGGLEVSLQLAAVASA